MSERRRVHVRPLSGRTWTPFPAAPHSALGRLGEDPLSKARPWLAHMSRVSVGILALTQLRLERRFGRALGSWRIKLHALRRVGFDGSGFFLVQNGLPAGHLGPAMSGAGRRAAKRLATRQGASIADRLVKKRPEMWPGRPVLTPCQVVLSHERGPGLHITQRVVPHVQHPPARYHSALDVHGERVEPAGGCQRQPNFDPLSAFEC